MGVGSNRQQHRNGEVLAADLLHYIRDNAGSGNHFETAGGWFIRGLAGGQYSQQKHNGKEEKGTKSGQAAAPSITGLRQSGQVPKNCSQ